MPGPNLAPLIPKPDLDEASSFAKKMGLVGAGITLGRFLAPKFPKVVPKLTELITGFEPVPGKGIKLKPGFFLTAAPEPIGATPAMLSGLPNGTGHLDFYYSSKSREEHMRVDNLARDARDIEVIQRVFREAEPLLKQKDIATLLYLHRENQLQIERLGPRPDVNVVTLRAGRPGSNVDSRLFLEARRLILENEIDERLVLQGESPVFAAPLRTGTPTGIVEVFQFGEQIGELAANTIFIDAFFAANPPDP